jgi:hypothetical protein
MPETLVPGLKSKEAREALAAAVIAVLDRWAVSSDQQAVLLGLSDVDSLRQGAPLPDDVDVLARAGHLLAIDRALRRYHGERERDAWLLLSCCELGGRSPLARMLTGADGLEKVRALLEEGLESDPER